MSEPSADFSVSQQVKLDAICLQFEQAWRQGERPRIELFLQRLPELQRPALLSQLLLLELEYLEPSATPPNLDDYLPRFPGQQTLVRRAFDDHAEVFGDRAGAPAEDGHSGAAHPPGTVNHEPIAEHAGSQIGRYKLLEQIGEGGMGVVYMADQQRPVRRKVALKIIKPGMDTKQVIARFEAERQALAIMDHPNIARVLDAGSTDSGRPYFVMELVRGIPMTEYCDQNKLPTDERLELFISVCQAVQHAHQKGIIHRDIKPTNVLVTLHDGVPVPKIIDFGVAKATNQQLTERTLFTAFAQMVGTPLYMSPEQAEMSGLDVDTRSDIYSLGVLLYELLTGATPFDRKRISTAAFDEIRRIIREEEPDRPSTRISSLGERSHLVCSQRKTDAQHLRQLLSGELDWIVMKALEKDRTRRYQTARGLAADVQRYLAGAPVEACPPTLRYRLSKFIQRYKAEAAVASLFLFLLLASTAVAWILFANARSARNEAVAATSQAVEARQRAESAAAEIQLQKERAEANYQRAVQQEAQVAELAQERQRRLYDYNLIKAAAAYRQDEKSKAAHLLADCLEEQRGWEWHWLATLTGGQRTLQLSETPITAFSASPVDSRIMAVDSNGILRLFDLESGDEIMSRATDIDTPGFVGFSPAGSYFAVANTPTSRPLVGKIQVWKVATGDKVWDTAVESEGIVMAAFSPDERHLCFGSFDPDTGKGTIHLYDLVQKKLVWREPYPGLGVPLTAFTSDAKRIYVLVASGAPGIVNRGSLHCWSVKGPTGVWSASPVTTSVPCPTPDGSQVITGGPNHSLQIRAADTGELITELSGSSPDVALIAKFSPDGRYLASMGHHGNVVVWDWNSQRPLQTFTGLTAEPRPPALTHSGEQLVLPSPTRGAVEVREVVPAPNQFVLAGHEMAVKGVVCSPDGRQVVSASRDGTLRFWNAATGQELRAVAAHPAAFDLAVSPQRTYFATGGSDGAKLWSTESGQLMHHWPAAGDVWWLDFSPDGERIVAGGGKKVLMLFDVNSHQELLACETPEVIDGLIFCADGRRAVTAMFQTGQLDIWDLESGNTEPLRPSEERTIGRCLVKSPQGNIVAAVVGSTIELWDLDDKQLVKTLRGDGQPPYCLAFNHDGSRLFSGDTAGVVTVWNLDTDEQLLTIPAHEAIDDSHEGRVAGVLALALSPDGKTLATAGADGLVKLWETTRPSRALAVKRQLVRQATEVVDQRYQRSGSLRSVLESLTQDTSLERDVLATAVEIANARGDRPRAAPPETEPFEPFLQKIQANANEGRQAFVDLIEAASGEDLGEAGTNPSQDLRRQWFWIADLDIIPLFSTAELEYVFAPLHDTYPDAHQLLCLRGLLDGHAERWQEAEAAFSAALEHVPEKSATWHTYAYPLAFLHVHLGHFNRYRALCKKAMRNFRDTSDPRVADQIAKMCLFSPQSKADVNEATRLAYFSMDHTPSTVYRWFSLAAGIAECRRGNDQLAIEILRQARGPLLLQATSLTATSFLFEAMAYEQLTQHEPAQDSLSHAEQLINSTDYSETGGSWWDKLATQSAHEEVKLLLEKSISDEVSKTETPESDQLAAQRIVLPDSQWKWLHPAEGIDPATQDPDFHSTFCSDTFDDSLWQSGRDSPGPEGGFGYGNSAGVEFDLPAPENRKTAYFRHRFSTNAGYDDLIFSCQMDDGVIVYLDGQEVGRVNVSTSAEESFDLFSEQTVEGGIETWAGFYRLNGALDPGDHVLAISLHNREGNSSDLRIAEISLWGTPRNPQTD